MSSLLDAEFLRRLEALRRRLVSEARSGNAGENASNRRGFGAEFREHRAYVPGDDPRRVDWMAYARTGEPVVKLYSAEEDRVLRLLIDGSASLDFGSPTKLAVVQRWAAALAYLSLASSGRAQLFVARENAAGGAVSTLGTPRRGRRAFGDLCRQLEGIRAQGKAELSRALESVIAAATRPGLLLVLSDFFDPGAVMTSLSRARSAGHDVFLLQVLAPDELAPQLDGDYALVDSETQSEVEVSVDNRALAAYASRLTELFESLGAWARRHGAVYVRITTQNDLEAAVRRVLRREVD